MAESHTSSHTRSATAVGGAINGKISISFATADVGLYEHSGVNLS